MLYFMYHVLSSGWSLHGFSVLLVASKEELNFKPVSSQTCFHLIDSSHSHLHQQLVPFLQPPPADGCLDLTQQHIFLSGKAFSLRNFLFFTWVLLEQRRFPPPPQPHFRDSWIIFFWPSINPEQYCVEQGIYSAFSFQPLENDSSQSAQLC